MKLILKSLLFCLLVSGSLGAQPAEFSPAPCDQNLFSAMFYNFFIGQIGGAAPTSNDWVGAIDAQNNLIGLEQVEFFVGGFGCPPGFGTSLQIASEQTTPNSTCPPPPYGGSLGEELEIVAYRASDGLFFTISTTVQFVPGASGASVGNCFTLNFTEPYSSLPVSFERFSASARGGQRVALDWVTASEQNSSHFEVQHSTNGRSWETIGRVDAAGESNSRLEYSFQHLDAVPGQNIYRLRQVDFDGTFYFSPVAVVDLEGGKGPRGVEIFPNPAVSGVITLSLEGEWTSESRSTLYDINGRQVAEWAGLQSGSTTLELPQLPAGIYQLVSRDRSASVSKRLVLR